MIFQSYHCEEVHPTWSMLYAHPSLPKISHAEPLEYTKLLFPLKMTQSTFIYLKINIQVLPWWCSG